MLEEILDLTNSRIHMTDAEEEHVASLRPKHRREVHKIINQKKARAFVQMRQVASTFTPEEHSEIFGRAEPLFKDLLLRTTAMKAVGPMWAVAHQQAELRIMKEKVEAEAPTIN